MKYVQASSESAGATLAQQAKYTESMQYSLEKLNNAWEALIKGMSSSEFFITVVDSLTEILKLVEKISPLILPIAGTFATIFGAGNTYTSGFITILTNLLGGKAKGLGEKSSMVKGLNNIAELLGTIGDKFTLLKGKSDIFNELGVSIAETSKAIEGGEGLTKALSGLLVPLGKIALIIAAISAVI